MLRISLEPISWSTLERLLARANAFWPTYVAGWSWHRADTVCFVCRSSGQNSVNHGEILLEYGTVSSTTKRKWRIWIWMGTQRDSWGKKLLLLYKKGERRQSREIQMTQSLKLFFEELLSQMNETPSSISKFMILFLYYLHWSIVMR